jgi:H+/Cl- antiporter ClcA
LGPGFFLVAGAATGLFAGLCAYLISYGEYKHHFWDDRKAKRMALQTAFATFVVFFVLILVASRVLGIVQ